MVRTNLQEFAGDVHVLSNLQVGSNIFANDLAANVLTVIGSIGANIFIGDGGLLSNIATTLDDIIDQGNTVSNTVIFVSGNDATSNTGIMTYSNVGISISNTAPTGEYQLTVGSNIFANTHASNVLSVVGRIGADYFVGDGGLLSNIATTLDQIVDQGNTISNTVILESGQDTTSTSNIGLITRENVGISVSNSEPSSAFQLTVGDTLFVNTYSSNALTVEGNVLAQKLSFGTATVTSAYNLSHVTAQGSSTDQTISLTNATTGLEVTSNLTAGGNVTAETLISTANVEVGNRLKFASNVFVDDLRVADLAANLVTYDKTTGELMDSGGLFANKLAVVSVQPPSALSANTTTIAKHGTYTVTTSSLAENSNAWNVFDGDTAVDWLASTTSDHVYYGGGYTYSGTSNLFAGNYIQPGVLTSSAGEWLAIEFPYKTTLRHMKLTPPATYQQYPASANVYATNDSLTWTEVVNWSGVNPYTSSNVQTITVNATEQFKKYAMVVTKTNGSNTNTGLAKWELFTESFSIDGGKVAMASSAVMGGETTVDQSGPHSRGEAKLKKYPEIIFEEGKFDRNDSTNTYVQAGYTVSASSQDVSTNASYRAFDDIPDNQNARWRTQNLYVDNSSTATPSALDPSSPQTQLDTNTSIGEYLILKVPKKIKLKNIVVNGPHMHIPYEVDIYGRNEGVSTWTHVKNYTYTVPTGTNTGVYNTTNQTIDATEYYSEYAFVVVKTNGHTGASIGELQLYGYEEDPPLGDTSVDTTFTSIMNTPQTTGANVYVDGNLGETFTNRVTGPDATGPSATYDATGKYWELNGTLTSNIAVEANTFLSGDAPHSLSMWFNSSNLEANVSNTCVFSISDQEKLDSVNLDLQSNTWHNLTYAYQGEGGSRVTYLDGRKVAEDQAEDTFGEYPPFAMTGYSQGGYVVSASSEYVASYPPWKAFDNSWHNNGDTDGSEVWLSENATNYGGTDGLYNRSPPRNLGTGALDGEWIKIEMPHKIKLDYIKIYPRLLFSSGAPRDFIVYGSNDNVNWSPVLTETGASITATHEETGHTFSTDVHNTCYKYFGLVIRKLRTATTFINIAEIKFYGHRENDLVRLPDPTNVLKYPHIAMTGPAQRGYVASAKNFVAGREPWEAFNGYVYGTHPSTPNDNGWMSNGLEFIKSTGAYYQNGDTFTDTASGTHTGPWIRLETPHKLQLSSFDISNGNNAERRMKSIVILGSDDASVSTGWSLIYTNTNITNAQDVNGLVVNSSQAFKYHMIVTKAVSGAPGQSGSTAVWVAELQLYGTGVDSIPIQIGGGNIDRVANFRVYDKFVGEDQALEIWDAQKDTFGRAKSSMTLQKGRLGIGTTEPEGRLAVLDEPNGLEEFPPRAMTGYKNYFEGHGEFCVYASTELIDANHEAWKSFNKFRGNDGWHTGGVNYTSGVYTAGKSLGGISGDYLVLKLPYKINLKSIAMVPRGGLPQRGPGSGVILGSNDEVIWEQVHSFSGITYTDNVYTTIDAISSTKTYNVFAMVVTNLAGTGVNTDYVNLAEWKLFGTREQGQSVLHDGQLTLTKSLTVPRIGPALDADDTPRRDRLVVEYNTSTNPTFEGAVRDTSGRGNDGAFYGTNMNYSSTEKALVFNGTDDYARSIRLNNTGGDYIHSVSWWFKTDITTSAIGTNEEVMWHLGDAWAARICSYASFYGNRIYLAWNTYNINCATTNINQLQWNHACVTYTGGGSSLTSRKFYLNGELEPATLDNVEGTLLNLPANTLLTLGARKPTATNTIASTYFDGRISNFKLYDTALTAEEVKTLYDMGRCDEGHHMVNFSKTRVGIGLGDGEAPTYTLDVRGQIRSQGSLVTSFTGQHKCVPEEPVDKGLIVSAKKNQFVKLNGSLDTGKSAITIDESLPVVSLSNVAKDKACFGVVSSTEEANTFYRVETTNGGVISYIPKTLGDNRAIVNSVGEGAIWVVNTNGSLEAGDYITTSNVAGYGQKQDDDTLHNYTVAKITMDCDFTGSNVAVQTIKREETGLRTITEDTWNTLVDYDRSSNAETQYSNTLVPSAYSGQSGYAPREVTTIVDYMDGSNTISIEEWSNLESNIQNTYQSNTFTEIVDYTKFISLNEWSNLTVDVQNTYSEAEITTYYQIQRGENVLDENGQLQWEDKTGATEAPYERRFLDASGVQTDSANAVHIAAFVGCTYHCG
jgi:hypothetical protein